MAEPNNARNTSRGAAARGQSSAAFTAEERAAMKEHAREERTTARRGSRATRQEGERDLRAKIDEMTGSDRAMAERIHAIVTASAPELEPRTWYGQPAYAKDGTVVCFFQPARKFRTRYATLGFSDKANLDDGVMWPAYYALAELTPAAEKTISDLVKKAAR